LERLSALGNDIQHFKEQVDREMSVLRDYAIREIQTVEEQINSGVLKGEKGDDGLAPTKEELLALIKPLIPEKAKDGKDYVLTEGDKKEISKKIKVPIVERVIEKTEVIKEQPIVTNEIKEVAVKDTPQEVKGKLKQLPIKEPWFAVQHILGIDDRIRNVGGKKLGGGGGGSVEFFSISGTVNGSNTTFTLPRKYTNPVICYNGQVLDPDQHYSISGTTLELTTAPTSGTLFGFGQPA